MLGSEELLAELKRLREAKATTNAELARLLGLPTSRIPEIFDGRRKITIDEMKILVDRFGLEGSGPLNAESFEPLLDALLPLVPPRGATDRSVKVLAAALAYGLQLLGDHLPRRPNDDALAVAARAAVARFHELGRA